MVMKASMSSQSAAPLKILRGACVHVCRYEVHLAAGAVPKKLVPPALLLSHPAMLSTSTSMVPALPPPRCLSVHHLLGGCPNHAEVRLMQQIGNFQGASGHARHAQRGKPTIQMDSALCSWPHKALQQGIPDADSVFVQPP